MDEPGGQREGGGASPIVIFTPVGTSIAEKSHIRDFDGASEPELRDSIKGHLDRGLYHQAQFQPAEISSLKCFQQERSDVLGEAKVHVILIHSPRKGRICADGVKQWIEADPGFGTNWTVTLVELKHLDPNSSDNFAQSTQELAECIQKYLPAIPDSSVYVNITGGYKGLLPYLVILSSTLAGVEVFYKFEKSTELVWLPQYAISFDYTAWQEYRSLLLPFRQDAGLSERQRMDLRNALTGTRMQAMVMKDSPWTLSPVGQIVDARYREEREEKRRLSDYGSGLLLVDQIGNPAYRAWLERRIRHWRYFSTGDRIPETVEHGRGHVQRLLEFTRQLLIAWGHSAECPKLTDEQLLVLTAAIWLHDIGHSGDFFEFEKGLVEWDGDEERPRFSVYGDPNSVRLCHHLLSWHLIGQERAFLLGGQANDRPNGLDSDKLVQSVRLTALYHRQDMPGPLQEAPRKWKNTDISICRKFTEGDLWEKTVFDQMEDFARVVALLRFVDASDHQSERAGDPAYYEVLEKTLERNVAFLETEIRSESDPGRIERLKKEKEFKKAQKNHFCKHRWIQHMMLVRADETLEAAQAGSYYGEKDGKTFILEGLAITDQSAPDYNRDDVAKKVLQDWVREYLLVESLLPFAFRVYLIEGTQRYQLKTSLTVDDKPEEQTPVWQQESTPIAAKTWGSS